MNRKELIERIKAVRDDGYLSATYLGNEHVGDLMGDVLAALEQARLAEQGEMADEQQDTIVKLRDQIEEARNAWWSATTQGDNGLTYTDRIEDAMDDIWSAIGRAEWVPVNESGSSA